MSFTYERRYRGKIQAVLLDWAGTTMDYGCMAPAVVFVEVFKRQGVPITMDEARAPMGAHKRVHIKKITELEPVARRWQDKHGRKPTEADVDAMFAEFVPLQLACLSDYSELIPGTLEAVAVHVPAERDQPPGLAGLGLRQGGRHGAGRRGRAQRGHVDRGARHERQRDRSAPRGGAGARPRGTRGKAAARLHAHAAERGALRRGLHRRPRALPRRHRVAPLPRRATLGSDVSSGTDRSGEVASETNGSGILRKDLRP